MNSSAVASDAYARSTTVVNIGSTGSDDDDVDEEDEKEEEKGREFDGVNV